VARLRREWAPDVIDVQYQTAAYGMHPAINLLPRHCGGLPVVATFHDLKVPYLFPKAGPLRAAANRRLARAAAAAIVTNAEDWAEMAGWRGIRRRALIPIGSNIPTALPAGYGRAAWRRAHGLPENALVMCYFGVLNASKGGEDRGDAGSAARQRSAGLPAHGGGGGGRQRSHQSRLSGAGAGRYRCQGIGRARHLDGLLPPKGVSRRWPAPTWPCCPIATASPFGAAA
jgi:hypothetical protein